MTTLVVAIIMFVCFSANNLMVQQLDATSFQNMMPNGNYILKNSFTVTDLYLSVFTGTLDGNGETITLNINNAKNIALFANINGSTIKNLTVTGSVTTKNGTYDTCYLGRIVAYSTGNSKIVNSIKM